MALVKAAELFKRRSSAVFREYGLSFSQYNALRVLAGEPEGEASLGQIGRSMLASGPNLSGIARRLEEGGFVRRRGGEGDQRLRLLKITAEGRRVLEAIAGRQEANVRGLLEPYSQREQELMRRMLRDMLRRA